MLKTSQILVINNLRICRNVEMLIVKFIKGNIVRIYPLNWRFLPVLDPQVDIILVRDLDSNISAREVNAVKEFMSSNKVFSGFRIHISKYYKIVA